MLSSNDFIHPYAHLKNADEAIKQFCDNCRKKLTFINKTEGVQDCNLEWCSLYARRWGKAFVRQLPELHTVRNNSTGKLLLEYKGIQGIHSVQLPQMCIELKCSMCIQSSPIDGQQTKRYNKNLREEWLSCLYSLSDQNRKNKIFFMTDRTYPLSNGSPLNVLYIR